MENLRRDNLDIQDWFCLSFFKEIIVKESLKKYNNCAMAIPFWDSHCCFFLKDFTFLLIFFDLCVKILNFARGFYETLCVASGD